MLMENAPDIILFWYFMIAAFVLMIALMIMAMIFIRKGKRQNTNKLLKCLVHGRVSVEVCKNTSAWVIKWKKSPKYP